MSDIPEVIINNDGYMPSDVPELKELHSKVKEWPTINLKRSKRS